MKETKKRREIVKFKRGDILKEEIEPFLSRNFFSVYFSLHLNKKIFEFLKFSIPLIFSILLPYFWSNSLSHSFFFGSLRTVLILLLGRLS